jgi:hypothetical protein
VSQSLKDLSINERQKYFQRCGHIDRTHAYLLDEGAITRLGIGRSIKAVAFRPAGIACCIHFHALKGPMLPVASFDGFRRRRLLFLASGPRLRWLLL